MSKANILKTKNKVAEKRFNFILQQLYKCYCLMLSKYEYIPNNEPEIEKRLYCDFLVNDNILKELELKKYIFDIEVPQIDENYIITGRADIKVSHNKDEDRKAFYIIELKRIDGGMTLNREYIKEGIQRFTLRKYPSFFAIFGMLGFVVKPIDIYKNVIEINRLIQTEYSEARTTKYLQKDAFNDCFYQSEHTDSENKNLKAYHQFWNFSSLIK